MNSSLSEDDVVQRARQFVARVNTSGMPDDLTPYAKEAKARIREETLGPGESGSVMTLADGRHVITVNSLESEARRRFTICHEIGHLELNLPSAHDEVPLWAYAKRDPNEHLCDIFAAELLMPYRLWKAAVPKGEPSLDVIDSLRKKFKASFPAAASRYAELADFPCAFVTMERGTILYSTRSLALKNARAWIARRTPIPEGSVSRRLRELGADGTEIADVAQDVWFDNWGSKGSDLREIARHFQHTDTTVALLWLDDDELPEREVDRFGARVEEDEGLEELTGELPWPGKRKRK